MSRGFLLLELSIAMFLFSILSLLILDFYIFTHKQFNIKNFELERALASDILRRDIMQAKYINDDLIFHSNKTIKWKVVNRNLIRTEDQSLQVKSSMVARMDHIKLIPDALQDKSLNKSVFIEGFNMVVRLRNS